MRTIQIILPSLLIIGGFIGMALSLPSTGLAVVVGLILYPTIFPTPKIEKIKDYNNKD